MRISVPFSSAENAPCERSAFLTPSYGNCIDCSAPLVLYATAVRHGYQNYESARHRIQFSILANHCN